MSTKILVGMASCVSSAGRHGHQLQQEIDLYVFLVLDNLFPKHTARSVSAPTMKTGGLVLALFLSMANGPVDAENLAGPKPQAKITVTQYYDAVNRGQKAFRNERWDVALRHLEKAARWGDNNSQYMLGAILLEQRVEGADPLWGYAWIKLAAKSKNRNLLKIVDAIERQAPKEWVEEGKKLSESLGRFYGLEASNASCKKETTAGTHLKLMVCRRKTKKGQTTFDVHEPFPL